LLRKTKIMLWQLLLVSHYHFTANRPVAGFSQLLLRNDDFSASDMPMPLLVCLLCRV
jgi:hypothetical protein